MKDTLAEILVIVIVPVVAFLIARAFAWWKARLDQKEDKNYRDAVEALEVGVLEAWESIGRTYRLARLDGKLDATERMKLREYAIATAKDVAKEKGLDVLKIIGKRTVPLIIRKIVEARKKHD